MDPAYLSHLEYMHMFRPDIAAAAAAAASATTPSTTTNDGPTSPSSVKTTSTPTTALTSTSNVEGTAAAGFKLPLSGLIKPPNPHMDHIFGLRQQLLSAASSAAAMAAASSTSPGAVSPASRGALQNSSPASSLERPRSPIDLDDTSNDEGSNSVTSPKSLSGSSASAFRQVRPSTLRRPSPDSADDSPTAPKREKHVWRPY